VLVHVGFAIARIDEREATATLDAIRRMGKTYTDELDAFRAAAIVKPTGRRPGTVRENRF
jgi:hydrogenase expression/formation protein HypC